MQPPAGSESLQPPHAVAAPPPPPGLAHTRSGPLQWTTTALAVAAVLGASALLQPSHATAAPPGAGAVAAPQAAPDPATAPDPRKAVYPMDCGPESPEVVRQGAGDLDGDGRLETVAVVRCKSGFGTPPSGIYVLAPPAYGQTRPRIVETFLDPKEDMSVSDFAVHGRTVSATLLGYSSEKVPRCCPDRQRKVEWRWRDGKFGLTALPVAGSV